MMNINKETLFNSFIKALPWVLVTIGIILIIVGYIYDSGKSSKILITIGGAILSSGVFAVILKSFQFAGVFKKELSKIVTDHEYLDDLSNKSKTKLWKKITTSLHKDNFPKLNEQIHDGIIENYFPTEKKYYFEKYRRFCKVKWDDAMERIILSEETISVDIIPKSSDEAINHTFSYCTTVDDGAFETTIELMKLDIDGVDFSGKMKESKTTENGKTIIEYSYNISLQGNEKYTLQRVLKKKFSLSSDPYSRYYSETFILDCSIKVEVQTEGLKVIFVESGTDKQFKDRWVEEPTDCGRIGTTIEKDYPDLLFPRQGYVLHYHCE